MIDTGRKKRRADARAAEDLHANVDEDDEIAQDAGEPDIASSAIGLRLDEEQIRTFVLNFLSEEQKERYFAWKGVAFKRSHISKIVQHLTGVPNTNKAIPMIIGGVTKSYIGELLQLAMDVKRDRGHDGPLRREHIREAYRQYRVERAMDGGSMPSSVPGSAPKRLFR